MILMPPPPHFYGIEWYLQLDKYLELTVHDYSPDSLTFTLSAGLLCEVARGLAVMRRFDRFDRHSRMLIIRK